MTTTAAHCTRTGCGGTIDDGYCTVCGLAETPAPVPPSVSPAEPATCTRTDCGGTMDDGYCAVCGLAAPSASVPAAGRNLGSIPGSAVTGTTTGIRGTHASTDGSSRGNLGAGLVEIPPVPAHDPAGAILADPQVPESQRFCSKCEQPVGRARDGQPGLADGFCRNCGAAFSFTPKLHPGDLLGGQYEVLGCLHMAGSAGSTWPGTAT